MQTTAPAELTPGLFSHLGQQLAPVLLGKVARLDIVDAGVEVGLHLHEPIRVHE